MNNYNIDAQALGERIRKLRLQKNKTQAYFADILYISPSYLALIEAGKRVPNLDVLVHIAEITDVSIDYLIFGDNKEPNSLQLTLERLNKSYPPTQCRTCPYACQILFETRKRTFRYQRFYKLIFFSHCQSPRIIKQQFLQTLSKVFITIKVIVYSLPLLQVRL